MKPFLKQASLVIGLLLIGAVQTTQAVPILGGTLSYTGGSVTVESLPVTSGFTSKLNLYSASFGFLKFLLFDEPPGVTLTFDPGTEFGISVGAELIFGIEIVDTGDIFFIGAASRNPDGIAHATVDSLGGGVFVVGFEDLYGGGDFDYDDNKFEFTGGIVASTPEPGALALLALALAAVRLSRRRRAVLQ